MGDETNRKITQERLKELLHYDPDTGNFYNIVTRGPRAQEGTIAGTRHGGYWRVCLSGAQHYAHRLAVLYVTGEWPKEHVDHINGDTSDNRWANLRPATRSENMQNRRGANSNSKTKLLGVKASRNVFRAQIKVSGRCVNLGTFSSPEAAHDAYLKAKAELHPFSTL